MALLRLEEFDPNYRNHTGADIQQFDAYTSANQLLGSVVDAWVDEMGIMQQLVVDVQLHNGQKRLMLPFGRSQMDLRARRLYLDEASLAHVRKLMGQPPAPSPRVSQEAYPVTTVEQSAMLETDVPLEGIPVIAVSTSPLSQPPLHQEVPPPVQTEPAQPVPYIPQPQSVTSTASVAPTRPPLPASDATTEAIDRYDDVVEQETIPLLEEQLVVNRERQKRGEVVIRKEIETEIIEVPVQREKLIIEEVGPNPKTLAEIDLNEDEPPIPGSGTRQVKRSPK